jgi:hypothetical protein
MYGAQERSVAGGLQVPLSQVQAGVSEAGPSQAAALQAVPLS